MADLNPTPATPDTASKVSPTKQTRWRSPVLWAGVAAIVLGIAEETGLLALIGIPRTTVTDVIAQAIQLLSLLGVLNNPTNPVHF